MKKYVFTSIIAILFGMNNIANGQFLYLHGNTKVCYGKTNLLFASGNHVWDCNHNELSLQYSYDNSNWTDLGTQCSDCADCDNYSFPGPVTQTVYFRVKEHNHGTFCSHDNYSNTVIVTVYSQVSGGIIGSNQTICYNTIPNIITGSGQPSGAPSYSYKWKQSIDGGISWADISGEVNSTYQPPALTKETWYIRETNFGGCGIYNSNIVKIIVYLQLTAGIVSADQAICYNTTPNLLTGTLPTGGDGNYSYQWQRYNNSWYDLLGATSKDYQPPVLTSDGYYQRIVMSGGCDAVFSNEITILVYNEVNPGTISSNQNICYNTAPTQLTGTNPSGGGDTEIPPQYYYKWQKSTNGGTTWSDIIGATNSSYSPGILTETTLFQRMVKTIFCDYKTTNAITITVLSVLNAGTIGNDQSVCYNGIPNPLSTITQPSGATGNYTYQWQISGNSVSWSDIIGATNDYYVPSNLISTTYFRKKVTSGNCSTLASNIVSIIVFQDINAGTVGNDQTIAYNSVPTPLNTITQPTGGTGSYTYQWQYSYNEAIWTSLVGATNESYSPPALTNTIYYRRIITSGTCGTKPTNSIKITVLSALFAGTIGGDQTICYGTQPTNLTQIAPPSGGSGVYTYQWQKSIDGTTWSDITGATDSLYSPLNLTITTYFKRKLTDAVSGIAVSNIVTITVMPVLNAGTIGDNQSICYNGIPVPLSTITQPSGATGSYTFQWQISDNGANWSDIPGTTNDYYVPSNLISTTYYRKKITSGNCAAVQSNIIKITVYNKLNPGIIGNDQTIAYNCIPSILNGSPATGGSGNYSYQWQFSIDSISWTNLIVNANSVNYQSVALKRKTFFRRYVTSDNCGSDTSNIVIIIVLSNLTSGTISDNQTICYNTIPNLLTGIFPTGCDGSYIYQWQYSYNDTTWYNTALGNSSNYQSGVLQKSTYFRRQVSTTDCGIVNSNLIYITVLDSVPMPTTNLKSAYCKGSVVTISVYGSNGYYNWYDENKIFIQSGNTYTINNFTNDIKVFVQKVATTNCTSPLKEQIIKLDYIKAAFSVSISQIQVGNAVKFTNLSQNAQSYTWNFFDGELINETSPWHYYNTTGLKDVKLIAISQNNCEDSLTLYQLVNVVSLNEIKETEDNSSIEIYPNPTSENLNINFKELRKGKIEIYSMLGMLVYEKNFDCVDNSIIDMQSLKEGIYNLKIITEKEIKNFKVVKQ